MGIIKFSRAEFKIRNLYGSTVRASLLIESTDSMSCIIIVIVKLTWELFFDDFFYGGSKYNMLLSAILR